MYFTDVWSGVQSVDGGLNWVLSNGEGEENIDFRVGPSLDNIPIYALRIIQMMKILYGPAFKTMAVFINRTMEDKQNQKAKA